MCADNISVTIGRLPTETRSSSGRGAGFYIRKAAQAADAQLTLCADSVSVTIGIRLVVQLPSLINNRVSGSFSYLKLISSTPH